MRGNYSFTALLGLLLVLGSRDSTASLLPDLKVNSDLFHAATIPDASDDSVFPDDTPSLDEIERNPQAGLRRLRSDLRRGSLRMIPVICPLILESEADNLEAQAFYCIHLAVNGQHEDALRRLERLSRSQETPVVSFIASALAHRASGDLDSALEAARRATETAADHPYAWNVLGSVLSQDQNFDGALAAFEAAVDRNSEFKPGYDNLGAIQFLLQRYEDAARSYKRALEIDANSLETRRMLGLARAGLGDRQAAIEQLEIVANDPRSRQGALPPLTALLLYAGRAEEAVSKARLMKTLELPHASLLLADAYLQRGNVVLAEEALSDESRGGVDVLYVSCFIALAKGEPERTIELAKQVLEMNKSHQGARECLAVAQLRSRSSNTLNARINEKWLEDSGFARFIEGSVAAGQANWASALESFRKAEQFVPGFSVAGLDSASLSKLISAESFSDVAMAALFYSKGQHPLALRVLETQKVGGEGDGWVRFWEGMTLANAGARERARETFERLSNEFPTFRAANFSAGELSFTAGDIDKATRYYERAYHVAKEVGLALRLGLIYEKTGETEKAEARYLEALEMAPDFYATNNQLAWFYAARGVKLDRAMELALRANDLQPGNASILDTIGWLHALQDRWIEARKYLAKAARIAPNNPTILFHHGSALIEVGEIAEGREALESSLKISDQFEEAAEARALLDALE